MRQTLRGSKETRLEAAIHVVSLLVNQKVLFGKGDEVGLVLYGTHESSNDLATDDQYQHITIKKAIAPPDMDLARDVLQIEPEGEQADVLDALIVAMDLLMKRQAEEPKQVFQKRLFLVTDAATPINMEDTSQIVDGLKQMDAKLNVIGIEFTESDANSPPDQDDLKFKNEQFLGRLIDEVEGVTVPIGQAIEMMSFFKAQPPAQRASFRGLLQIGNDLSIPIQSFIKTMVSKPPTAKKISTVAMEAAEPKSMNVIKDTSYQSTTDPDREVPVEERIKGMTYGKTLVPFSKVDETVLKYESEACLKVIGFTSASKIPRFHFFGNVECFVAPPGDTTAGTALSALIRALAETDSVAIVRYVKRNKSVPHLGVLHPHIRPDCENLYYNSLPFSEDIRQYPFAPLDPNRMRKGLAPSQAQLEAADQLIDALDLVQKDGEEEIELFKPKHVYNPTLQRLYQAVQSKAVHPNDPIPPLDPIVAK
eukprot:TRINITY_DN7445_c0_g1_i3.p1 TRINITY_DN7445_c0_g1~~TRINITY_DN7445_c0_g1_i3.p1  ORF type:complete len:479 (+),score=143.12 TRINITY_DN7445_c0_g1_i3:105-1541(+)